MLLGETVIYIVGLLWLRHVLHTPLEKTLEFGLYPFVVGDLLKVYAAAAVLPPAHRWVRHLRKQLDRVCVDSNRCGSECSPAAATAPASTRSSARSRGASWSRGHEVVGVREGWRGMVEHLFEPLGPREISGILPRGGTIIGTSRTNPYKVDGGVDGVRRVVRAARRARRDRRRGHARRRLEAVRRVPAARSSAFRRRSTTTSPAPTTPSASTPPSRSAPRRSTGCTRRPSRTTA